MQKTENFVVCAIDILNKTPIELSKPQLDFLEKVGSSQRLYGVLIVEIDPPFVRVTAPKRGYHNTYVNKIKIYCNDFPESEKIDEQIIPEQKS